MYRKRHIRRVSGLITAQFIETPAWTQGSRARGKIARGRAYENAVGRELSRQYAEESADLYLGPWIGFTDANGTGIAQPDALIDVGDCVLLVEVKLKQNALAREQIEKLYRPLVEHIFKKRVVGVEIFKYPAHGRNATWVRDLKSVANRKGNGLWVWHFIGG